MTIITDRVEDVAGAPMVQPVTFTVPTVRQSADGDAIVVPQRHSFRVNDGQLTTTDLDPGPAIVTLPGSAWIDHPIEIPDSSTPVRLWPLIDAGIDPPPQSASGFLRVANGDEARIDFVSATEFAGITQDPATAYLVFQD